MSVANRARGEVTLSLGGDSFVLSPSFGAVCQIEDATGTSLYETGRRLESAEITARELVAFAQACLASAGHAIERDRLGALIVVDGTHAVIGVLLEFCRNYAFGGAPEKKDPTPMPSERTAHRTTPSVPT